MCIVLQTDVKWVHQCYNEHLPSPLEVCCSTSSILLASLWFVYNYTNQRKMSHCYNNVSVRGLLFTLLIPLASVGSMYIYSNQRKRSTSLLSFYHINWRSVVLSHFHHDHHTRMSLTNLTIIIYSAATGVVGLLVDNPAQHFLFEPCTLTILVVTFWC